MKKRWIILISVILISVISIKVYGMLKNKYETSIIKGISSTSISSIRIEPESAGAIRKDSIYFDFNNNQDRFENIVDWIKSGSIVGNANNEMLSMGGSPTFLIIELKNGTSIRVKSAIGSITTKLSHGIKVDGRNIDGQVTIYISGMQTPIREYSPQLKSFIENGWKSTLNNSN